MSAVGRRGDWTEDAQSLRYLRCMGCSETYYLPVESCPGCGSAVAVEESSREGECTAASSVPEKYSLGSSALHVCLVRLDEGFTILCHRDPEVRAGNRVFVEFTDGADGHLRPYARRSAPRG